MKKILFWSLVLLPTLLFATDMGGIFCNPVGCVRIPIYLQCSDGTLIHLLLKKSFILFS
ncbi:MAG: hypothetical protein IPG24_20805 [Leptospiraceae bacterium]|nr:hypothetical protein [Leptospiraceae bacterium]